jgi:hypothetical protein
VMPPTDLLGLRPVLTSRPLDVHGALPGASAAWFGAER